MVKAIVTRQNPDGSYDEVGMNNRMIVGPYKTEYGLLRYGVEYHLEHWAKAHHRVRIEIFPADNIYGSPIRVKYRQLAFQQSK